MFGLMETFAHHFRNLAFRAQDFRDAQAAQDAFLVGVVRPNDHRGNPKSSKFNVVNTVASKFSPMATTAASRS